jgi:hypothetical protein
MKVIDSSIEAPTCDGFFKAPTYFGVCGFADQLDPAPGGGDGDSESAPPSLQGLEPV